MESRGLTLEPPKRRSRIKGLNAILAPHAAKMDAAFKAGAEAAMRGQQTIDLKMARWAYAEHRPRFGFKKIASKLLSWPTDNYKLHHGQTAAYGQTLQHHVQRINDNLIVNACEHAGVCVSVCVLDNGHGNRNDVQMGRRSKTAFLVEQPEAYMYLLGWEMGMVYRRHLSALWRPNVNSDVRWEELIPSAFDGSALGSHICAYDYTKDADRVLDTDGWLAEFYRVSFSWNEEADARRVVPFLERGGSVAVVTARKKHAPVYDHLFGGSFKVLDADLTDEWMFESGVVGDLSAKGKARRLIGKSDFVVIYKERNKA